MEDEVQLIREARELIDEYIPKKNGKIPGPYKGYVAGFVTNLNQMGIVPTLLNAYDSGNPTRSAEKPTRHDLVKLLASWYNKANVAAFMEGAVVDGEIAERDLIQKALALKQALRLFPLESYNPD